jgi:inhibitor of KinA
MLTFKRFGTHAMLVEWEQRIHPTINSEVIRLYQKIKEQGIKGIQYLIPAYCSLTIGFDNTSMNYNQLLERVQQLLQTTHNNEEAIGRNLLIPVCYEQPFALDIDIVAAQTNLPVSEIIRLHTSTTFQVYMLGFLPGFPYLGILPESLKCERHAIPRTKVPAQSVGLAGLQTGIYPSDAPGGWMIIGRTPIPIFDANSSNPFHFRVGDKVRFYDISSQEFEAFAEEN